MREQWHSELTRHALTNDRHMSAGMHIATRLISHQASASGTPSSNSIHLSMPVNRWRADTEASGSKSLSGVPAEVGNVTLPQSGRSATPAHLGSMLPSSMTILASWSMSLSPGMSGHKPEQRCRQRHGGTGEEGPRQQGTGCMTATEFADQGCVDRKSRQIRGCLGIRDF